MNKCFFVLFVSLQYFRLNIHFITAVALNSQFALWHQAQAYTHKYRFFQAALVAFLRCIIGIDNRERGGDREWRGAGEAREIDIKGVEENKRKRLKAKDV